jgi:hypothetical protein
VLPKGKIPMTKSFVVLITVRVVTKLRSSVQRVSMQILVTKIRLTFGLYKMAVGSVGSELVMFGAKKGSVEVEKALEVEAVNE